NRPVASALFNKRRRPPDGVRLSRTEVAMFAPGLGHSAKSPVSPPDAFGSAAIASEKRPVLLAEDAERVASPSGKIYAVPTCDVVPASGRLAEVIYRGFEIMIALIGL